ncbi:hypothetical protein Q5P01_007106 [Channa striata]|uniref:TNFR-Cys domain-containing protein n=1 Tax=Channa striata TaxID=64152 RepID=A0AA88N2W9_CHASR|nr:hypothetical protein Q5P01_007106 [Channa striata]
MFPTFVVLGCVAVLAVPALCCRDKEYTTRDGQCCPMCQEGTIVQRDCTPQSGTRCAPCLSGTFMNQANGLTKCFPCTLCNPVQGLFEKQKCKAKTDTVCGVLSGYFCTSFSDDETGCSLAEKHKDCKRGQSIKESGTNRSDTVCEDCKPGYFSLDGINCTAWTVCLGTQTKVTEGSSSHDVVCRNASRHHYVLTVPLLLVLSFLITLGFLAKVASSTRGR